MENGGLFRGKQGENRSDLDGMEETMILEWLVISIRSENEGTEKPHIERTEPHIPKKFSLCISQTLKQEKRGRLRPLSVRRIETLPYPLQKSLGIGEAIQVRVSG